MSNKLNNKVHSLRDELERKKTEAEKKLTLKRKRIIAVVTFIIGLAVMGWLCVFISKSLMLSIETDEGIYGAAENFKNLVQSYGNQSVFVAFGLQMLQVVVSPIPGEVIETGMGLCFGWLGGALICLLGGAAAALIIMLFVKKFGIKAVELFVSTDKINELKFINNEKKLKRTVFLLYLIPGTPKDPLIFFFGLTKISVLDFVVLQTIARIPSVVSSTVGGKFLVEGNYLGAIWIYAITGALALIGLLFYNKIIKLLSDKKEHKKEQSLEQRNR